MASVASYTVRRTTRPLGRVYRAVCTTHALTALRPPALASLRFASTASTIKRVKEDRLMSELHHTCQWGPGQRWGDHDTDTGMSRLSLSDTDKQVRDWFASTTEALGCTLTTDEMGNQFAVRAGKKSGAPTYVGSHLDTQPTGGRYDGILGVHAGIEMLQTLRENNIETNYPVGVVNWTNEEGARFPISMVASGVWAGEIPLDTAHSLKSVIPRSDSATMKTDLERIGYLGSVPCSHKETPMAAHFELHIEQGPILEKEERKVGIVTGVQAYRWFTITITGHDCHTGSTDLGSRADALLAASKMIVASREAAYEEGGLASTGIIEARPGSTNTVPGLVTFSLDIRGKDDAIVEKLESRLREEFAYIASGKDASVGYKTQKSPRDKVAVKWRKDSDSPAVLFSDECITCVTEACEELFGNDVDKQTRQMVSGAGHDSVYTSKRVPTSMVFVPSKDGISHNPVEYTKPEDCTIGAQVLMGAVLKFDGKRTE
ncbi:hypothetical protein FH972_022479 [Carpinus fangiana]|uniref:Peptidase M20 dimerisation domain-containing protein n=1 Tax=Carpinus fangiana TaxID=176857 RepID=A0A5N6KSP1_9ROSI|nr:hypothetical protein FH972_022479 [Carpinus fangiana]